MKRPSFQFYPGDWQRDTALRLCSIGARGCWMEMLCIMHQSVPYGYLLHEGRPLQAKHVASLIGGGASTEQVQEWIDELEAEGVLARGADGVIYSRRMVRDEGIRQSRAAGGAAGAEHGIKGASHGSKGGRPKADTGDKKPPLIAADPPSKPPSNPSFDGLEKPPLKPPPSSSSSSSIKKEIAAAATPPPRTCARGQPVDNFSPPPAAAVSDKKPTAARYADLLRGWEKSRGKVGLFQVDDPLLDAWAQADVTELELRAAYDKAVKRRGKGKDPTPVNIGLIDVILPEVRHGHDPPSALATADKARGPFAWALSWQGIVAKGAELGLTQQPGELEPHFKARVHAAAGTTDVDRARLLADFGVKV